MSGGAGASQAKDRLGPDPPLIAGRVHGVRVWMIDCEPDGDFHLVGYGGTEWSPVGEATHARCVGTGPRCRRPPSPDCSCGLYGRHPFADDAEDAVNAHLIPDPVSIGGIIEAWGRVELHEGGFRAQHARPVVLFVPPEREDTDYELLVERIADRYAAQVLYIDDSAELVDYCRAHEMGLDQATVLSLLGDRTEPRSRAPSTPPPALALTKAERILDGVRTVGAWLFALLFLLMVSGVGFALLSGLLGWEVAPERRSDARVPLHGERSLKVVDEELVAWDRGRWLYLATVRNTGDRAAIGVVPRGRLLDRGRDPVVRIDPPLRVEGRANLAPGETGLVWDTLRPRPGEPARRSDVKRFDVGAGAIKHAAGPRKAPISVASVSSDRELCIVTSTIDARRPMRRARVALVGRKPNGDALGVRRFRVGPLVPGRSDHLVARIPPRACRDPRVEADVYPALTRRQLLGPRRDR